MRVYIYIYICIYMHIIAYIFMYIHAYNCIYIYIYIHSTGIRLFVYGDFWIVHWKSPNTASQTSDFQGTKEVLLLLPEDASLVDPFLDGKKMQFAMLKDCFFWWKRMLSYIYTGWWFQTFFLFHNIWDNPSHWPIYICIYIYMLASQKESFLSVHETTWDHQCMTRGFDGFFMVFDADADWWFNVA